MRGAGSTLEKKKTQAGARGGGGDDFELQVGTAACVVNP